MEPLFAVLVASAARLDEAVREEAQRRAVLERGCGGLVALVRLDAEREPAGREQADRPVRREEPNRRVAGARGRDVARFGIDRQTGHRDEVATGQLSERDLVGLREERGGIRIQADERAEGELRERHVRGRSDPVTARVTEHDRELSLRERQEVVDVPADLDARRRLVDGADLEPLDLGQPAGEQRALHRVREVLSLLREPGVIDRERGLACHKERRLDLLVTEPPRRVERDDRQRRE